MGQDFLKSPELLEKITLSQLKTLSYPQLEQLAEEIRQKIIATVSTNGGHLSSNLGVVELTIALHRVFNSPVDKIIFDVSHQTYPHKLLTGRYQQFDSLRKFGGLSGFAKTTESPHDIFEAGHSSTSLSAGLGILLAKEENPEIGEVVCVIGDASVTNGLAFEALNQLGASKHLKMIIIINDNDMSISKNVGSLAKTFNKIRVRRQNPLAYKITPKFTHDFVSRVHGSIRSLAYQKNIFEALDFKYFVGIDGHNLKELERYLTFAKNSKRSVVLHLKTQKGRGYKFAEEDCTGIWHNPNIFTIDSGLSSDGINPITFGEHLANQLVELVNHYPKIRVITPGMSLGSGLNNFKFNCPKQFIDVGIAEEHCVVMAAAMASQQLIPIIFIYSTFLQRAYDQLLHDVGRSNQSVIFCVDRAGIVPGDGDTHQGIFDIAFLKTIPNFKIIAPSTVEEGIEIINYLVANPNGPVAVRYPKYLPHHHSLEPLVWGKWKTVMPINDDTLIVVISYGSDVILLEKELNKLNLSQVALINALFIKPLDYQFLRSIINRPVQIVVYEQVITTGSLASAIIEFGNSLNLSLNVKSFALPETYLETGNVDQLKDKYQIGIDHIINYLKNILNN